MGLKEDIERVALQERELELPRLDSQVAWELGTRLRTMALERGLSIVADVRRFGQPLFYMALEGTTPDNVEWVRRKSNVVAQMHRSSYGVRLGLLKNKETLLEKQGLPVIDYAEHGGSFPLRVAGAGVVGSVTVSGLDGRDDHGMAVEALCFLLGRAYTAISLPAEQDYDH
ncbi:MAG: heme-degrading domain-containing protein [Terracidiphilus sp.]|nr:heme-degrading domain-containing protein [Terracidiphilus sp.]